MILLPATRALYAAVQPVHLRASFNVLFGVARDHLGLNVLRSAIVLFFNRDRTRCKLIFSDGSGFVLLYKRLDRGRFARVEPTPRRPLRHHRRPRARPAARGRSGLADLSGKISPARSFLRLWSSRRR